MPGHESREMEGLRHWLLANIMFYLHHKLCVSLPVFPINFFLLSFYLSVHNCSKDYQLTLSSLLNVAKLSS
jgi:hypothetical protein